jgi:hypothetical protein
MSTKMTFLLVVLFTTSMAHAQWDTEHAEILDFASGPVGKNLAISPNQNVHTIFRDGNWIRYYQRSNETGEWSEAETVNDSASMSQLGEFSIAWGIAIGQPIVVYTANERVWFARRNENGTWTRYMLGDSNVTAMTPDLATNVLGMIRVVYVTEIDDVYELECGFYYDGLWEYEAIDADLGAFGSGAAPRVGIKREVGTAHVIFRAVGPTGYQVQHANTQTTGWLITNLEAPHPESYPGDIAIALNGTVHCVTQGSDGFGIPGPVYYHVRDMEGNWTFGTPASGNMNAGDPQIALDNEGHAHTVWLPLSGNFYTGEIYYSSEITNWEPELIFDAVGGGVAFAVDNESYGHLLLENVNGDVMYLRSDELLFDPGWGPEISIEPDTLEFDTVIVGEDSTLEVSLLNPNEAVLRITDFEVVSPVFHLTEEWHTVTLMWGWSTTVDIRFAPQGNQLYSGYAVVTSDAIASPDTVYLTGRGVISNDASDIPLPLEFALHPLYPNPFNGAVNVSFSLPKASEVSLSVYDVLGREVGQLLNGTLGAGEHRAEWNCAECAGGIYLFRLEAAGQTFVQKAVYAK